MAKGLVLHRTAERPELRFWLLDDDGTLIDFSAGYSFSFKLGAVGATAMFTKTSGITGAAGAGSEPAGDPNVTITFSADELDDLEVGPCDGQLTATSSSLGRVFQFNVQVRDVIA